LSSRGSNYMCYITSSTTPQPGIIVILIMQFISLPWIISHTITAKKYIKNEAIQMGRERRTKLELSERILAELAQ